MFGSDRQHHYALAGLCLLAAASAAVSLLAVGPDFWMDDAFISFRYARNLFEGHGVVYNSGERVEGYTNFGWMLLAYLGLLFHVQPIRLAQAISVAAQLATLAVLYRLGREGEPSPLRALIAPLLLAFHIGFVTYPMSGMETSLFTLLVTLAVLLLRPTPALAPRPGALAGVVLLLLALVRFDGLVMAGILVAYVVLTRALSRERGDKGLTYMLGVLALGVAVYNLWRIAYFQALLPHTFHAKVGFSARQLVRGLEYLLGFLVRGGWPLVLLAAVPLLLRRLTATTRLSAWVTVWHLCYVVAVGGDWMPHSRFVLPVMPLIVLLAQAGLWLLYDTGRRRLSARPGQLAVQVLFAATLTVALAEIVALTFAHRLSGVSSSWFQPREAARIGQYLDWSISKDRTVAIEWGGIVPFFARQRFLELSGLADKDIVARVRKTNKFGREVTPEYLVQRRPDLIVPCARLFPSATEALESMKVGQQCGRRYYGSLAQPRHGYEICVIEVGLQTYWPAVTHLQLPERNDLCVMRVHMAD